MKMIVAVVLIVWICTVPARAALGEPHESVQLDMQRMKGTLVTRQLSGYSVEEIKRPDGAILREFVSPDGKIFGVAWQGMTMPNLTQILGPSAADFQLATAGPHRRGPLSVHVGHLVVQTGGHMRDYHVRAYLDNLLPSGVTEDVVQ